MDVMCIMLAATHIMFTKDQRGGFRRAPGDPPTPILEKTLVSRNDFLDIRNKKIKKIKSDN